MAFSNSAEKFGSLTKFLHWSIAGLFVVQFYLVYRREYFMKDTPEKLQYILLHKSFGVCILLLGIVMILWRWVGTRPIMPINMSTLETVGAKFIHILLYLSILVMPLSGILMSNYGGHTVSVFGYALPVFVTENETLSYFFYRTHQISSYIVIGIVSVHVLAALYHHFVKKDNVLKRML